MCGVDTGAVSSADASLRAMMCEHVCRCDENSLLKHHHLHLLLGVCNTHAPQDGRTPPRMRARGTVRVRCALGQQQPPDHVVDFVPPEAGAKAQGKARDGIVGEGLRELLVLELIVAPLAAEVAPVRPGSNLIPRCA